jgi:prolyl oligopeptidase PreP (S9A serine peptidase family)
MIFDMTAEQLCIQGGSNGGLLVLAVALQRPKLFKAVVSQVRGVFHVEAGRWH